MAACGDTSRGPGLAGEFTDSGQLTKMMNIAQRVVRGGVLPVGREPVMDGHAGERRQDSGGVHRGLPAPSVQVIEREPVGAGHVDPPQLALTRPPVSSKCATWAWLSSLPTKAKSPSSRPAAAGSNEAR